MPKYEVKLAIYRTIEADNIDEAADIADEEKARILDEDLACAMGWRPAVVVVSSKPIGD